MTDTTASPKKTLLIEDFPVDLKIRAKVLATLRGMSLRQWAIISVTEAVSRGEVLADKARGRARARDRAKAL